MSLGKEAHTAAAASVEARLQRLQDEARRAAEEGLFTLSVELDDSWGAPLWWWDSGNQNAVGDHLTKQGVQVKFKLPRGKQSLRYPALFISWYDRDEVLRLYREKTLEKTRLLSAAPSNGKGKEESASVLTSGDLIVSGVSGAQLDAHRSDVTKGLIVLREPASYYISFLLTTRPGAVLPALRVVVSDWQQREVVTARIDKNSNQRSLDLLDNPDAVSWSVAADGALHFTLTHHGLEFVESRCKFFLQQGM